MPTALSGHVFHLTDMPTETGGHGTQATRNVMGPTGSMGRSDHVRGRAKAVEILLEIREPVAVPVRVAVFRIVRDSGRGCAPNRRACRRRRVSSWGL